MDCVVFAGYFNSVNSKNIANEFSSFFKEHYEDCDFYIGINPCRYGEYFIKSISELQIKSVGYVPNNLVIDSDASAYQFALRSLRNKDYNIAYFFHSKGSSTNNTACCQSLLNFFKNRDKITQLLKINGSYSAYLGKLLGRIGDPFSDFFKFDREMFYGYLYFHTIYALKFLPLKNFIDNCKETFFDTRIKDRYYFERDFPHVIWRQGYYPTCEHFVNWNGCLRPAEYDLSEDIIEYNKEGQKIAYL